MSDTRETLRRGVGDFAPRPDAYRHVLQRRDRKARNRRLGAFVVVALIALAGTLAMVRELRSAPPPLDETPRPTALPSNGAIAFSAFGPHEERWGYRDTPRDLYLTPPGDEPRRIAGAAGTGSIKGVPRSRPMGRRSSTRSEPREDSCLPYPSGARSTSILALALGADGMPTGAPTVLLSDERHMWGCPAWSPDGSSVAVVSGPHELLIVRPDGTSFSLATGAPTSSSPREAGYVEDFAWSPDGTGLAVLDSGAVWLVPVDGSEPEVVWTPGDRQLPSAIAWAPDGRRLAVSGRFGPRNRCCDGSTPFLELVQMRDGSRASVPIQGDAGGDARRTRSHGSIPTGSSSRTSGARSTSSTRRRRRRPAWRPASTSRPTASWCRPIVRGSSTSRGGAPDSYAIVADPVDGGSPVVSSPWSLRLYTNYKDFAWQPIVP